MANSIQNLGKIQQFNDWNSSKNVDKFFQGEEVEDFEMFKCDDPSSGYLDGVKNFSQDFINFHDVDKDSKMSYEEFVAMSMDGEDIPAGMEDMYHQLFGTLFKGLQANKDDSTISANEFAAQFVCADMDWENATNESSIGDLVDGKLNFYNYNTFATDPSSPLYEGDVEYRKGLYEAFFSEE